MKVLFLLFGVAFLVFQAHGQADPQERPGEEPLLSEILEAAPKAGENGPAGEEAAAPQMRSFCYGGRGYCMLRSLGCPSGYMYKEQYNNCVPQHKFRCCA